MPSVAIIEKNKSNIKYEQYFDFDFEVKQLCDTKIKKVLKKDVTLEFDPGLYDFVILVGADVAKHIGKITSILKYQGFLVNDKFLPLTSPSMLTFKPDGKGAFDKAVRDISNYVSGKTVSTKSLELVSIEEESQALVYIDKINKYNPSIIAVDSETTALYPRDGYVLGVSITYTDDEGVYISSDAITEEVSDKLRKLFCDTVCIFHNAKFDIAFFEYHFNWEFPQWEDTMLLHYCLNEQPGTHSLKELALKYTDLGDYDKELDDFKTAYCRANGVLKGDFTYDLIPFDILASYAAIDTIATFKIFNLFYDKVKGSAKLYNVYSTLLREGTDFLVQVQDNGVPFCPTTLFEAKDALMNDLADLNKELYTHPEIHAFEKSTGKIFNPNSVIHLREIFFTELKLPIPDKRTATGAISTDAEVLEELAELHPIPKIVHNIKKLKKIKSTYIDKIAVSLDMDNRLRTNFNLTTTTSGRLSSSGKLNMQQLPRDNKVVKKCIKARPGWKIVSIDLKTAEMYIVAALCGDKALQKIFIEGGDYHSQIAKVKFKRSETWQYIKEHMPDLRQAAKSVSFEILYKLNFREEVLDGFPRLKEWLKAQASFIQDNGYTYSFFGRKRRLPNVFSKDRQVSSHEVRSGVNALVQGPASDVNLLAGIDMQKHITKHKMQALIFGLVHDSILAEVPDSEVDAYLKALTKYIQTDRGLSIKGHPIGVDIEIGQDYSFTE